MACGIKPLYATRESFPEKTRLLILKALISHVQYSAIFAEWNFRKSIDKFISGSETIA